MTRLTKKLKAQNLIALNQPSKIIIKKEKVRCFEIQWITSAHTGLTFPHPTKMLHPYHSKMSSMEWDSIPNFSCKTYLTQYTRREGFAMSDLQRPPYSSVPCAEQQSHRLTSNLAALQSRNLHWGRPDSMQLRTCCIAGH